EKDKIGVVVKLLYMAIVNYAGH
nr:hypothetical protein [Tanacetum cinerariifolium]